jgi:hypothetical protein
VLLHYGEGSIRKTGLNDHTKQAGSAPTEGENQLLVLFPGKAVREFF